MLNENKIRGMYIEIQKQLFRMIPEKWEELYLYASIIDQMNYLQTGEMFFYYYPVGILRKNPINVYEIPTKFNIEEETYEKLIQELYSIIKRIRQEYENYNKAVWTNLTISIAKNKFKVEYYYEDFLGSEFSSYDRHLIWQYKYLHMPLEKLTKRDRQMVKQYIEEMGNIIDAIEEDELPLYKNRDKYNQIEYLSEKEPECEQHIEKTKTKKIDKYEQYKEEKKEETTEEAKNQILNF